ncbi:E3 ubiquitin-protein ligase RMND5A isoform X1 [Halyomorpha halys]|uniref:E3 ubiquitin-protein ligase RMND5A isoform X1 n=1 Tax=Halyomorpha halys TaxID=286706 RepID=UPI0006D52979|nr:protein RMD5 homolog A [Halyomorpha halys]
MEACVAVEREVDKVLTKFGSINEHAGRTLRDVTNHIEALRKELSECPPDHELTSNQVMIMKQAMSKARETVQRLATDHRDLHSTVSKVGKAIDRNFVADFASTSRDDVFSSPDKVVLLNKVICQHFYRQGMLDIADELASEAGVDSENGKEPFTELNYILDCLKHRDLDPALEWAEKHRTSLQKQNSSLEFKLHQLRFIGLIEKGSSCQNEAIQYARTYLSQFVHTHEKDIQMLMGMLLYLSNGVSRSPYAHLLQPSLWADIYDTFTKDACSLLGLSVESPLSVCVNAGCIALPALLNIKQVMQQRQVSGIWNGKDELPIEIDLGPEKRFHSVFACPILKQQSTEINPPMRLACGHVISRDALNKLANSNKLKCPYCPMEQNPADARIIYF